MGTMAVQVREHVNLAERPFLERRLYVRVGHDSPIAGGDLATIAKALPEQSRVVGCGGSGHEPNRTGILSLKDPIERSRERTVLVASAHAVAVNVIALRVAVDLEAMFAHCGPQILIAETCTNDRTLKRGLQVPQREPRVRCWPLLGCALKKKRGKL